MQLGLNENIIHKGERYHIQTEDGGRKNPLITTLLFRGGVVIASKRISYADILRFDKLDTVVRETMIEQHKEVIKNLLEGVYDRPGGKRWLKDPLCLSPKILIGQRRRKRRAWMI